MKKSNRVTIRTGGANRNKNRNISTRRSTNKSNRITNFKTKQTVKKLTTRHAPKTPVPQTALKIITRSYEQEQRKEHEQRQEQEQRKKTVARKESRKSESEEERLLKRKRRFQTQKGASPSKKPMLSKNALPGRMPSTTLPPRPKPVVRKQPVVRKPVLATKQFRTNRPIVQKKQISIPVVQPVKRKKQIFVEKPKPVIRMPVYSPESESSESESESESEDPLGPELNVNASGGALVMFRNLPKECGCKDLLMELFVNVPGIEQISILRDEDGNSKGMADVAFASSSDARECIKSCRDIVYRNHEIYPTLMGSNTVETQPRKSVIGQRRKRKKRKKKNEKNIVTKNKPIVVAKESKHSMMDSNESYAVHNTSSTSVERARSPPPSLTTSHPPEIKLRITSPTCVVPETRPWNWGGKKSARRIDYDQEYVPPDWSKNAEEDTCYHVTMKGNPSSVGGDP